MKRRDFLRSVGVVAAGATFLPVNVIDRCAQSPARLTIPARYLYARIQISIPGTGTSGAWAAAVDAEYAGLLDDLDPPSGQHCVWRDLERGRGFAGYLVREERALCSA